MKRLLTIFLTLALLAWSAPVSAIKVEGEKIEKKDDASQEAKPADKESGDKAKAAEGAAKKTETAPATKSRGSLLDKLRQSVAGSKTKTKEKPKYDQFRDANNDGVSDRVPKAKSDKGAKSRPTVKTVRPVTKEKPKTNTPPAKTVKKTPTETTKTKKKKP
jgi:hypothetical protein